MFDFHDFVSSGSHLLMAGFMLFVGLIMYRLTRRQPLINELSLGFYCTTAVILFTLSGFYHSVRYVSADDRRFWQVMDQSAIFFLIFGSNVPLLVYFLPPRRRNWLLLFMGAIAVVGAMSLWTKPKHEVLALAYVAIGFTGMLPMRTYFRYLRSWGLFWIFIMATAYTSGAVCEAIKWPVIVSEGMMRFSYHEVLHICVIVGTLAHVILLVKYVIPHGNRPRLQEIPIDRKAKSSDNFRVVHRAIPPGLDRL